jgi:predicted dehydrogenase
MRRRQFLSLLPAGLALADTNYDRAKLRRVGLIGSGWYGKCDLLRLIQVANVEVVSLCDVNKQTLAKAGELVAARQVSKKTPRLYTDYRKMLAERDLDICLIATPDHWHALYLQKPISVDVVEGQAILATARKLGRSVQVGTQRRSTPHLFEARDRIFKEGRLGRISQVDIYCHHPMRSRANPPDAAAPDYLDWDLWTGPAPAHAYNPMRAGSWRAFMEYGNGIMGDMGIHMYDMVRWLMGLGAPSSISSTGGIYLDKTSKSDIADTQSAIIHHDDLNVVWNHRTWGQPADPDYPWGATFYGELGTLRASVFRWDFKPAKGEPIHRDVVYELDEYPEDKTEERLEKHCAPAIRRHMQNLLAAVDGGPRPVADIEQGYISTSACILSNVAMELGRTLQWDAAAGRVVGDEEANRWLERPYRAPWRHPRPGEV